MKKCKILSFILLLAGVYGVLLLFFGIEGIRCDKALLVFAAPLPVLLLWAADFWKRRLLPLACLLLCVAAFVCFRLWPEDFVRQPQFLVRCFLGHSYWQTADVTLGLFLVILAFSVLFYLAECVLRAHWLVILTALAFMSLLPVCGIVPDTAGLLLLSACLILFAVLHQSEKGGGSLSSSVKILAAVCGICLLVFSLCFRVMETDGDRFFDLTERLEIETKASVRQAVRQYTSDNSRLIARGALETDGKLEFYLSFKQAPTETLYLRSFSGGNYQKGRWLEDRDREIFDRISGGDGSKAVSSYLDFQELYYRANRRFDSRAERYLEITWPGKRAETLTAYYGERPSNYTSATSAAGTRDKSSIHYFEEKDMAIDWLDEEKISVIDVSPSPVSAALHFTYQEQAEEIYTELPAFGLSDFRRLCEENPKESLSEITGFIRQTLREHAVYTTDPGNCPAGKDPVSYFFFENHKGYCQHFASAAVILYRLYGVPARYAAGYAVKPSDFSGTPFTGLEAAVTDEAAHAWVEIFLEDKGWTPVEVTPGGAAFEETPYAQLPHETQTEQTEETEEQAEPDKAEQKGGTEKERRLSESLPAVFAVSAAAALMAAAFAFRGFRRRRYARMDGRKLFARLLKALHWAGIMREYQGCEADFVQTLCQSVPDLYEDEVRRAVSALEALTFGKRADSVSADGGETALSPVDELLVGKICEKAILGIYQGLSPWKKFRFRYVRGFLM